MNKITESILDRPFTVKWQDNPKLKKYNDAIVSVEGLKDMYIKVGKNFRIDLGKYEEYGKRQINYLESHRYDISEKLMELSEMSNDQIQVCLEKLKAEKGTSCTSFLSEFKPKYQNFNSEFCSFVRRHHLDSNDDDTFYTFAIEDLKESWEEFYTGGDSWADRLCLFYPAQYLYKMNKNDVVDHEKWEDFMSHSSGGRRLEDGYYYTLQTLDEAFEKFEENKMNMNKNLEATLAESFEKTIKNLQKEGLFENVKSFDLELKENKLNIKLNENIATPTAEELHQLETQFYSLVDACEKADDEYRSKFSNIYLVYLDSSESEHTCWKDENGKYYYEEDIDWDDDDNEVINGIPLDQFKGTGGTAVIDFPMYSLDEPEKALNGNGRLVGVMCEYLAEEADPKSLFMSKLRTNNFIKKFCNKYHLTPMFYIGSRDRGDKNWENKGADICSDIWNDIWDPNVDGPYDTCEISGPFGVSYDSSSDF